LLSVTTLEGTEYYTVRDDDDDDPVLVHHPSGSDVDTWREGYPYDYRMSRSEYEEQKRLLQIELLKLQKLSQTNGLRHVIVFEGRDAAGKGGTIKRFMEHLNPRGARVVALEKPTERELTDTDTAPWTVVKSNDKKRARVNAMRHVLTKFDYDNKDHEVVGRPDPLIVGRALTD
jgi:polyphosphate kinase 2 (PPK2 family)